MINVPIMLNGVTFLNDNEFNPIPREIENAIKALGYTLDDTGTDLSQLSKAITSAVSVSSFYQDSGLANLYNLAPIPSNTGVEILLNGMRFRFYASNTNTGASTLNVNGLGAKSIVDIDGSALTAGAIQSGREYEVEFDSSNDRYSIRDLEVRQASETQKGILELATQAEVNNGTNDTTAITPLKLENATNVVHTTGNEIVNGQKTIDNLITSTQNAGDSSTKAATTAFVENRASNLDMDDAVAGTLAVNRGGTGVTTSTGTGSTVRSASPALTGNPTAPTQPNGNSSTRIATTAFVQDAVSGAGGSWVMVASGNSSVDLGFRSSTNPEWCGSIDTGYSAPTRQFDSSRFRAKFFTDGFVSGSPPDWGVEVSTANYTRAAGGHTVFIILRSFGNGLTGGNTNRWELYEWQQ